MCNKKYRTNDHICKGTEEYVNEPYTKQYKSNSKNNKKS